VKVLQFNRAAEYRFCLHDVVPIARHLRARITLHLVTRLLHAPVPKDTFKAQGLHRRRRLSSRRTEGAERAEERLSRREVRSYEAEYVNSVWHWDGHQGSLQVLTPRGEYETPRPQSASSTIARASPCHLQWYLGFERAQV